MESRTRINEVPEINASRENRSIARKIWTPRYLKLKKTLLAIFAFLAAGFLQLFVFILYNRN